MEYIYQSKQKGIFRNLIESFFDFVSPRTCEVCREYTGNEPRRFEFLCDKCFDKINLAQPPEEIINRLKSGFNDDDFALTNAFALFSVKEDHDFMNLIYSLKYYGANRIGTELGYALGDIVRKYSDTKYNAIIPVPIHHARMRERGYNQSYYIAKGLNMILNSKVDSKIIKRSKYTQTQTALGKDKRRTNINGAIIGYDNINIKNHQLLLVDDVLTTGSTVNVCADVLLEMGAKRVDVATIVFA